MVVAAAWGTEFLQFLAALATVQYFEPGQFEEKADLHQDELKNMVQISLVFSV